MQNPRAHLLLGTEAAQDSGLSGVSSMSIAPTRRGHEAKDATTQLCFIGMSTMNTDRRRTHVSL